MVGNGPSDVGLQRIPIRTIKGDPVNFAQENGWQLKLNRRKILQNCSLGFGALAMHALNSKAFGIDDQALPKSIDQGLPRGAALKTLHHPVHEVKHVILCYMSAGVSHIDSFDPKPRLQAEAGKPMR